MKAAELICKAEGQKRNIFSFLKEKTVPKKYNNRRLLVTISFSFLLVKIYKLRLKLKPENLLFVEAGGFEKGTEMKLYLDIHIPFNIQQQQYRHPESKILFSCSGIMILKYKNFVLRAQLKLKSGMFRSDPPNFVTISLPVKQ